MKSPKKYSRVNEIFLKSLFFLLSVLLLLVGIFFVKKLSQDLRWSKLINNSQQVRPGMNKDEVIAIMGEPTAKAAENRFEKGEWDAFFYRIPQSGLFALDREIFIEFNPDNVNRVEIRPYYQIKFESEDWKQSTQYRRWSMVDDLIESKILLNLSEVEVVSFLGEPDQKRESVWEYVAGPERGFGVDSQIVIVSFSDNKVSETSMRTD